MKQMRKVARDMLNYAGKAHKAAKEGKSYTAFHIEFHFNSIYFILFLNLTLF